MPAASEWLRDALEAMAWDLSIDSVWEAWIAAFAGMLGGRLGMSASPFAVFECGRGVVRRRGHGKEGERCQRQELAPKGAAA